MFHMIGRIKGRRNRTIFRSSNRKVTNLEQFVLEGPDGLRADRHFWAHGTTEAESIRVMFVAATAAAPAAAAAA